MLGFLLETLRERFAQRRGVGLGGVDGTERRANVNGLRKYLKMVGFRFAQRQPPVAGVVWVGVVELAGG